MMRHCLALATAILLTGLPSLAFGQEGASGAENSGGPDESAQDQGRGEDCPPGGWFCEGSGGNPTPGAESETKPGGRTATPPPAPPPELEANGATNGSGSPSVVVVTPAGGTAPKVVVVQPGEASPAPRRYRAFREWGVNLRLEGVLMGEDRGRSRKAGMGGAGFAFRYRPIPNFAFEAGLDFVGGKDWQGHRRRETSLMFNGIVFFNPRDPVQFYTFGGFGFASATVDAEVPADDGISDAVMAVSRNRYSYFGGQLGLGLEFRVARRVALNADLLGFIRGRTDDSATYQPEFVDPEDPSRTTNTSGGGLLRGGITFYW